MQLLRSLHLLGGVDADAFFKARNPSFESAQRLEQLIETAIRIRLYRFDTPVHGVELPVDLVEHCHRGHEQTYQ